MSIPPAQPAIGPRAPARRRRAFTLVEMLIALFIAGIVLTALNSLVLLGMKAVPSETGAQASAVVASDALDRLASEVAVARTVTDLTATGVTLTLADWTGDAADETVRYAWSGVPGDPLVRAVNSATGIALAPSVAQLELTWVMGAVDESTGESLGLLTDQVVQSVSVTSLFRDGVSASEFYGHRVIPSLPADTIAWRPHTVSLWLQKTGSAGSDIYVELRDIDDSTLEPGLCVYYTATISSNSLPSSLVQVDIPLNPPRLPATEDVCIILYTKAGTAPAETKHGASVSALGGRIGYTSSDGGATWVSSPSLGLQHTVTADIWTDSGAKSRTTLTEMRLRIELGDAPVRLEREVEMLNRPEVIP